ncbi:UNVERIFIED_CONTAM: hypothetical protein PYX00_004042 [Menopon gallinae]
MKPINSVKGIIPDRIYGKVRRDGITKHSKPQVDRALASALKYGVFDVGSSRNWTKDDVLDDDDTIYCRSQTKRDKTPYRLELDSYDYINPEKDGKKFRRLAISDNGTVRYTAPKLNEGPKRKGRVTRQSTRKSVQRSPQTKVKRKMRSIQKAKRLQKAQNGKKKAKKRRLPTPKVINPRNTFEEQRGFKKRSPRSDLKLKFVRTKDKSTSTVSSDFVSSRRESNQTYRKRKRVHQEDFCTCEILADAEEDMEVECAEDDESTCQCHVNDSRETKRLRQSNFVEYKKPIINSSRANTFISPSRTISNEILFALTHPELDTFGESSYLDTTFQPKQDSTDCIFSYSDGECNLMDDWYDKANWTLHRPQYADEATIKQYDNGLKIEPIDSLPFKNLQETSYIS